MNGLVTVLGWLLLALTFISSYRLAAFLATDPAAADSSSSVYPLLIAATITIAFTVIADAVIFLTGLAVFTAPIYLLFRGEDITIGTPSVATIRAPFQQARDLVKMPDWMQRRHQPDDSPEIPRDDQ